MLTEKKTWNNLKNYRIWIPYNVAPLETQPSNLIFIDTLKDDARAATVLLPAVTAAPVSCQ